MSDQPNAGPAPSKRVFLYEVQDQPIDTKVRTLGCVINYDVPHGILKLKHHYPKNLSMPPLIEVDTRHILPTAPQELLQVGSWINVVGYVRPPSPIVEGRDAHGAAQRADVPLVQAILAWMTGPLDIGEYERVLAEQKEAERYLYGPSPHGSA